MVCSQSPLGYSLDARRKVASILGSDPTQRLIGMAHTFLLTWTSRGVGGHSQEFSWPDVLMHLENAWRKSGSVGLEILDAPDLGPQELQVQIEPGYAMLMLGFLTEDDHEVRTYANGSGEGEVEILGNLWPRNAICRDFDVVVDCFRQFHERGDVAPTLLE